MQKISKSYTEDLYSYCKNCYVNKESCESCIDEGQISMFPSVRACRKCITNNWKYIRRALLVVMTNCEEGSKQIFLFLKDKIEAKIINP